MQFGGFVQPPILGNNPQTALHLCLCFYVFVILYIINYLLFYILYLYYFLKVIALLQCHINTYCLAAAQV